MIVVMRMGAPMGSVETVVKRIEDLGGQVHLSQGTERTVIGVVGDQRTLNPQTLEVLPDVERVVPILHPFKLSSRDFKPEKTVISIGDVEIGGDELVVMAGPCAVESEEQLWETAQVVRKAGAKVLRGGAFKPRTSPYSFQGLGFEGLRLLREVADGLGMLVVTEVISPEVVPLVAEYADILQVGTRNMSNHSLLRMVGQAQRPVLLKRGMMATIEEFLMAAEYILTHDNYQVMLCERGIRTFETFTRNTLDINAVPALHELSHLPVIVDPSHGSGKAFLVAPASRAAIAAGADGLMVEVHPHPEEALSDGAQSLTPEDFATMMGDLKRVAMAVGRML
jgi:3-deoxy-7-phosphoheptulonate synthase